MIQHFARWAALATLAAATCAAQAASYTFTAIDRPGAAGTMVWDINDHGEIAGYSSVKGSEFTRGFVYSGGVFNELSGPAGAISSMAMGLSDNGVVVGNYYSSSSTDADGNVLFGQEMGFIYKAGTYTSFSISDTANTQFRGVSPDGRYIAGFYGSDIAIGQAFVLDTVSNSVTLVGDGTTHLTIAQGINASYTLVGSDLNSAVHDDRPGFTYDIGTGIRTDVYLPGATRTAFRAIDDAGVISGWYIDALGVTHGFTGYPGAFQTIDYPTTDTTFIEGSNNAGILVGNFGTEFGGAFMATPTTVPEPETWALMIGGLMLLPLARRRR
jgi:hypothetical protein